MSVEKSPGKNVPGLPYFGILGPSWALEFLLLFVVYVSKCCHLHLLSQQPIILNIGSPSVLTIANISV
jgi:hypothetical protein